MNQYVGFAVRTIIRKMVRTANPTGMLLAALLLAAPFAPAQATRPAEDRGVIELRARNAVGGEQYAEALPLLHRLLTLTPEADRRGPIEEQIRVCQRNLAAQKPADPPKPTQPLQSAGRTPHPAPPKGEVLVIAIKDLGNFDYDAVKGGAVPEDVKRLNGTRVRIRGYMQPLDQATNITEFALVPSLNNCCFGMPPQIQHTIIANTVRGKSVEYSSDEIDVEGTLTVDEKKDEGYVVSLFELSVTSVKPAH